MKSIADVVADKRHALAVERMVDALATLSVADLSTSAAAQLEAVYKEAEKRTKCSRADFGAGFVAALIVFDHRAAFRRREDGDAG